MRLLHTSDWHLGQELKGVDRAAEHERVLERIIEICAARNVDLLLIAGDVYHAANPATRSQKLFYATLARLAAETPGLRIAAIAGNHDSPARLELPMSLPLDFARAPDGEPSVSLIGSIRRDGGRLDLSACLRPIRLASGEIGAVVALIPYLRPGDLDQDQDAAALFRAAADAARAAAERCGAPDAPLILSAHLHAAGGDLSPDSERPILIGGEEAVPLAAFPTDFAYVALGHLHRPQTLRSGASVVRYAGSVIPLSAAERPYAHGVTLVEVGGGAPSIEEIPLPRPRRFDRLPETGAAPPDVLERMAADYAERLRETAIDPALEPFLDLHVSLETAEPALRARFEAALGDAPARLIGVRPHYPQTSDAPRTELIDLSALSPTQTFERLHAAEFGAPPPEDLRRAFDDLIAADGLEPETHEADA
ncbi:MAG: exonuclease SbcCD subunit D [Pseudomonadota bacterium]